MAILFACISAPSTLWYTEKVSYSFNSIFSTYVLVEDKLVSPVKSIQQDAPSAIEGIDSYGASTNWYLNI